MDASVKRTFYWSNIASAVYTTASSCGACTQNEIGVKLKRRIQLFLIKSFPDVATIVSLDPLSRTEGGS